jgi:hypothetical protein
MELYDYQGIVFLFFSVKYSVYNTLLFVLIMIK